MLDVSRGSLSRRGNARTVTYTHGYNKGFFLLLWMQTLSVDSYSGMHVMYECQCYVDTDGLCVQEQNCW
jgi:hypothetical protein